MAEFEYRYMRASTGRMNKATARAYDETELRQILQSKGIEPVEIVRLPAPPATERQLEYLRDLGVDLPSDTNIREASDLISNATEGRAPADASAQAMAGRYRVEITRFTSKERIYSAIVARLVNKGDYQGLAEWFVFRVYRSNRERAISTLLTTPDDPRVTKLASELIADQAILKSLRTAAETTHIGFRWFGDHRGHQGDSTRTTAYKAALAGLVACGLLLHEEKPANKVTTAMLMRKADREESPALSEARGCLGVVAIVAATTVLSFLIVNLLAALNA